MKRELEVELNACGFTWPRNLPRTWALDRLLDAISDDPPKRSAQQTIYNVVYDPDICWDGQGDRLQAWHAKSSYGPSDLLGLKLRAATTLRKQSRPGMFTRIHAVRFLDPLTDRAYKQVEKHKHQNQLDDDPHGHPWHTSFHASQFPGGEMPCPRKAVYGLADFAQEADDRKARSTPFDRTSRTIMAAGKAIELELVKTYQDAGILLSAAPDEEIQTGFSHPESWLTGSVDCVIKPPDWNKPLPIEIKSKYETAIQEMLVGARGPDENHVFQLKVQLALIALEQKRGGLWSDLEPVTHGFIFYLSRDKPSNTAEFRVDLDMRFFEVGVERLLTYKGYFHEEVLFENPKGKRSSKFGHPMGGSGFKWSQQPCAWCPFKKTCQLDFRQEITDLSESVGINRSRLARKHYDYKKARQRVLDRWADKE